MLGAVILFCKLLLTSTHTVMISSINMSALHTSDSGILTLSSFDCAHGIGALSSLAFETLNFYFEKTTFGSPSSSANMSFIVSVIISDNKQKSDGHGEPQNGSLKKISKYSKLSIFI